MQTQLLDIRDKSELNIAIDLLDNEHPIAFPTETVFGIGADIYSIKAAAAIYDLKNREAKKPLSAHISSIEMAEAIIEPQQELFYKLADRFLPGALAIIVKKKRNIISDEISSGMDTISLRFPDDDTCLNLIREYGKPLAATSANISGGRSLVNSDEVFGEFAGKLPAIIIGESKYKQESTIISLAQDEPKILRQGVIPAETIMEFISKNC